MGERQPKSIAPSPRRSAHSTAQKTGPPIRAADPSSAQQPAGGQPTRQGLNSRRSSGNLREHQRGSTFLDHARSSADDELGGRFARHQPQTIIGATPLPKYPAGSGPWSGADPVGQEPPLGFSVNDLEPMGPPLSLEAQAAPTSDAPSLSVEGGDEPRDVGATKQKGHVDD
jgi:hypothetical protein